MRLFETSPFSSFCLKIFINWHTKSQGPKKKCLKIKNLNISLIHTCFMPYNTMFACNYWIGFQIRTINVRVFRIWLFNVCILHGFCVNLSFHEFSYCDFAIKTTNFTFVYYSNSEIFNALVIQINFSRFQYIIKNCFETVPFHLESL